jgi:hypothetical protein
LALLLFAPETLNLNTWMLFDVGGLVSIVAMGAILVVSSIRNTHALYQLERLPER